MSINIRIFQRTIVTVGLLNLLVAQWCRGTPDAEISEVYEAFTFRSGRDEVDHSNRIRSSFDVNQEVGLNQHDAQSWWESLHSPSNVIGTELLDRREIDVIFRCWFVDVVLPLYAVLVRQLWLLPSARISIDKTFWAGSSMRLSEISDVHSDASSDLDSESSIGGAAELALKKPTSASSSLFDC